MAQGRMLKRKITRSKKFAALKTDKARLLWFYMLPFTDVDGRLEADAEDIRDEILRKQRKGYTVEKINECLQDLNRVGLIALYSIDGKKYLEITRFWDEQTHNPEREAQSEIPAPTQKALSEHSESTPLNVMKAKVNVMEVKSNTTVVFEKWNSFKGKKWKSHKTLSYESKLAITEQLKHYSVEELCSAVENYAKVLLNSDFKWSYAWTLQQFLTRTSPTNRKEQQLWRFLPNNYHDEDYLTDSAKRRRVTERKEFYEFIRDCEEEKLIIAYKANKNNLNWLIDEVRPEIKDICRGAV